MSLALKKLGHTVIEAKGGEEALKMIEESAVDLIFLDMIMPDVDGLETLERLKAMYGAASPPVVVVSSIKNEDVVQRALSLGRRGSPGQALQRRRSHRSSRARKLGRHVGILPVA